MLLSNVFVRQIHFNLHEKPSKFEIHITWRDLLSVKYLETRDWFHRDLKGLILWHCEA